MRTLAVIAVLLLAGCAGQPPPPETGRANATAPDTSATNGTAPADGTAPAIGERMPATIEHFVLMPDHSIGVVEPLAAPPAEANVPETIRATTLYEGFASTLVLTPWLGPHSRTAWESTADIEVVLKFMATQAAIGANPKPAGFPSVGAWFGSEGRYAHFLLASDAPDTLEANKVYTVHMVAKPPKGGFFLREGDQLALYTFLTYQTADGSPVNYVVGGAEPAGFLLPHEHFNLTTSTATVILDETGEIGPNPGVSGDMQQTPVDIAFTVPPEVVSIVVELAGAPKAGPRLDMDVSVFTPSGERIAGGSGPTEKEIVVLGPGNLAAYGRDLVARITNAANPSGATYTLKITGYS